jgi:PAS domain S-box-containing protein
MTNSKDDIFEENSESFFLKLIESLPLGILLFNSEGRITFLNNNFLEFCAYHKLDIHPSNTISIFQEDLFPGNHLLEYFQRLHEGYSFEKEIEGLKTFSLRKIIIMLKVIPLFNKGKFDGGILILQDIKVGQEEDTTLKNIESQWKEILNSSVDLLLVTDGEGNIKFSFGKKSKKFLSRISPFEKDNINNLFSKEVNGLLKNKIELAAESRDLQKFSLELFINNRPHDYECEIEPILDEDKRIKLLFFKFTDIRSFVKAQKILELKIQQLTKQKHFFENISLPIFSVDMSGKVLYWNKTSQDVFGYSEFQASGKYFPRLIGIIQPDYFDEIKKQLAKSKQADSTFKIINLTGQEETYSAVFNLMDDEPPYIVISYQNITEKIHLENKIKTAENRFNNIIQHSGKIIFTLDSKSKFTYANKAFLDLIEITEEELLRISLKELIVPEFLTHNLFEKLSTESESSRQVELPIILKDKRKIYLSGFLQKIIGTDDEEIYNGYFQDMTSVKEIINKFNLLSSLVKSGKEGISIEKDDKIILMNDSFVKIFGYSRQEDLLGKSFIELVADEDIKRISEYLHLIRRKMDAPVIFEFLGKHEDGSITFCSASVSEFEFENNSYLAYITRDITEQKRSQQALRESEEKYRGIIDNIDDFFFTYAKVKGKLRPVFYTASVQKITGYTQAELTRDQRLFFKIVHPDDVHLIKQKIKDLLNSRIKNSTEIEFRIFNKYGNIVAVRNKINVIRDEYGEVKRLYGIVSDISIRKKAEEDLKKSKEDLIKLNESKDRFLSIVSHDLRTPFSSILGFTDLMLNDDSLTEKERKQYIKYIQESSNSMLTLVNSLLDWNRLQSGRIQFEPEKICAHLIVEKCINSLAGAAIRKNISIKSNVSKEIEIFVDENLIGQVFNNLISNAIKFTNAEGGIFVSVSPSERLRFLEFSVQDNGVGINAENIKKLFSIDSKFTMNGTAGEKGSGMGLTLVKDIIQKHGGTIWVESEPGKGSIFKFTLPVASATILLVDDNKTDRLLYSKILKNITPDYNIEAASHGKEAMEKIIKSPPALVITDHNMPEMNGIKLVQEIQKLEAKLKPPIIILSADIDRTAIHDYGLLGIDYIFQKPVNLADFKQAVERTIRKGLLGE